MKGKIRWLSGVSKWHEFKTYSKIRSLRVGTVKPSLLTTLSLTEQKQIVLETEGIDL